MVDSTVVQAHLCAAGAQKNGGSEAHVFGRRRGGFSTNMLVYGDGLGNPLPLV